MNDLENGEKSSLSQVSKAIYTPDTSNVHEVVIAGKVHEVEQRPLNEVIEGLFDNSYSKFEF